MASPSSLYPKKVDLTNCDKEPIHKLNRVQNHGFIIACTVNELNIIQCSTNINVFLGNNASFYVGTTINSLLGDELTVSLKEIVASKKTSPLTFSTANKNFLIIPHVHNEHVILEFEPIKQVINTFDQQQQITDIITNLSNATDEQQMCDLAAALVKDFLGYDRVMIYRFDESWNGEVVSEAREENLESWLGLHYPATDIPQQARKLFLQQGVRIISEITEDFAEMEPAISPITNDIIDLSKSELRAPSLIHIEYLQNMKVGGTLTAAIVYNNVLWGLIACHHYSPKFISYHQRLSCKFLTQVFSTQLGLRSFNSSLQKINKSSVIRNKLVKQMSINWNVVEGLSGYSTNLLSLTEASGAAIYLDGELTLIGETPDSNNVLALNTWLNEYTKEDIFYSNHLSLVYPEAEAIKTNASGVLAIAISKSRNNKLFWFKPEILKTVSWGGNPHKAATTDINARLSPRKSFEKWSEEVEGQSNPWQDYEISAVKALKESISEIIVEKYEEVMLLNSKLEKAYKELESFSYSVSHDLRAPLRGIDGFAQIIKEDYYGSLDEYGRSALETIITSTQKMNELIDDILNFSGLHQKKMRIGDVDMDKLTKEILKLHQTAAFYPNSKVIINGTLPNVKGDQSMIAQLLSNLITNALKYSQHKPAPAIEIGILNTQTPVVFYIKDNGIGFDMKHKDAIFGVFNRLVDDSYPGSGIGLAIVKRVIEKHNGTIWVESTLEEGTVFNFCFNISEEDLNE